MFFYDSFLSLFFAGLQCAVTILPFVRVGSVKRRLSPTDLFKLFASASDFFFKVLLNKKKVHDRFKAYAIALQLGHEKRSDDPSHFIAQSRRTVPKMQQL